MAKEGLHYYTKDEVDEIISGGHSGSGTGIFMNKSVYDSNENGVVDNAEKVNGKTVQSNVPANAVFTDTIYDDTAIWAAVNGKVSPSDIAPFVLDMPVTSTSMTETQAKAVYDALVAKKKVLVNTAILSGETEQCEIIRHKYYGDSHSLGGRYETELSFINSLAGSVYYYTIHIQKGILDTDYTASTDSIQLS